MIAIKMHKRRLKVGMSVIAELLLDILNHQNTKGVPIMTLINRTASGGLGSPATNHRAINFLRENKYVKVVFRDDNVRTKYLVSTKKGLSHFEGLE